MYTTSWCGYCVRLKAQLQRFGVPFEEVNIELDPGMAFGTGSHPTTRLCLEWLCDSVTPGCSVLDYGCGSGILAIAATKLGAGEVLGIDIDERAVEAARDNAERNAAFLLDALSTADGRLWRSWKDVQAQIPGFLEDYANLSEGLLALYQATFEPRWYHTARELVETMLAHFAADFGFYDTADDAETLVVRPRSTQDNATPSGNAMAATVLLKLARLSLSLIHI